MEYVNVLSIIMDSDNNTTREYASLFDDIPTQFFVDSDMLSDTPIINQTKDGRFIALSKIDDIIVLEYFINGKGSLKSCTKKIKIEFVPELVEKLLLLQPEKLTNFAEDTLHHQLCMSATIYDLQRDSVDFNQVIKKKKYTICYYLRKTYKDHYFLQSEIRIPNNIVNNYQINEISAFYDISPVWQKMLLTTTNSPFIEDFKKRFPEEYYCDSDDLLEFEDCDDEDCEEFVQDDSELNNESDYNL